MPRCHDPHVNLPACFDQVTVTPATGKLERTLIGESFKTILEQIRCFKVACKCGSAVGRVLGMWEPPVLRDPIALECRACGVVSLVFDQAIHGFNGAVEPYQGERQVPRDPLTCSTTCASQFHTLGAVVTYQLDEAELDQALGLENQFDVIAFAVECAECGRTSDFASFECA
jgi:hypothetical protein